MLLLTLAFQVISLREYVYFYLARDHQGYSRFGLRSISVLRIGRLLFWLGICVIFMLLFMYLGFLTLTAQNATLYTTSLPFFIFSKMAITACQVSCFLVIILNLMLMSTLIISRFKRYVSMLNAHFLTLFMIVTRLNQHPSFQKTSICIQS